MLSDTGLENRPGFGHRVAMARSAAILLPKHQSVRFPDRCPVCGKPTPGHAATLDAVFGPLLPVRRAVMQRWAPTLPVCAAHQQRLRFARLSDRLALAGLVMASLALLLYLTDRYELFQAGWWSWAAAIFTSLVLPQSLMFAVARPLFDVGHDDEYLCFRVRNSAYAREFARLNEPPDPAA